MHKATFIKKIDELTNRRIDNNLLMRWKFPKKFLTWEWERVDKIKSNFFDFIFPYIENFPDNNPHSLYIHSSNVGMGKTVLATIIAKTLYGMQEKVRGKIHFISYGRFIDMCKEGNIESKEAFDSINNAKLLVIDDIGKEFATEWSTSKLYTIINERDNNVLPIIITSNFSLDVMIERLRNKMKIDEVLIDAIESRLKGICVQVNLDDYGEIKDNRLS